LYEVTDPDAVSRLDELEEGYRLNKKVCCFCLSEIYDGIYRKDVIVVEDEERKEKRVAIVYFGDTVTFDVQSNLQYVESGDVTTNFPFSYWK
jgi:hypothetical protein